MNVALHADMAPLGMLLGEWEGHGRGQWADGVPFGYREHSAVWHVGKPFLAYTQRTNSLDDGRPLHGEMGYWRLNGRAAELVLAHPIGFAEIEVGAVDAGRIRMAARSIERTPTAKVVTALERDIDVDGDTLRYELRMATDGGPVRWHLEATLHRRSTRPAEG